MLISVQMPSLLALGAMHWLFIIPICLASIFLTLLILVQRGRGGGLTGALGGMGGQSAFGTKAGDVFTKITIVTAMLWILLSMGALRVLHTPKFGPEGARNNQNSSDTDPKPDGTQPQTPEAPPATPGEAPPSPSGTAPSEATPAAPEPPAPATPAAAPADPAPAATPPAEADKE